MARPEKRTLLSFPLDVDFFDDDKLTAIRTEFGIKGEIVAIKLLCAIYRNGYFVEWNERTRIALLANLPGISADLLSAVVTRLARWDFLDDFLFRSASILTSRGIQRRYFEASRRRKNSGNMPYVIQDVYQELVINRQVTKPQHTDQQEQHQQFDNSIRESICSRFAITPDQLQERIEQFNLDCQCRGTTHNDNRDMLNHFNDWLRITLDAEKRNNNNETSRCRNRSQRRGVEAEAAGKEAYEDAF